MGISSFFARKGNVGGIARAVANYYHRLQTAVPTDYDPRENDELRKVMYTHIVKLRYSNYPVNQGKPELYEQRTVDAINQENSSIRNLTILAFHLLVMETGIRVDPGTSLEWMKIIKEELISKRVPEIWC